MFVLNEKGEKVKSNFFATDILSKIIQEEDNNVSENDAKTALHELLIQNQIVLGDLDEYWEKLKAAICNEIKKQGSYHMSTCIVEGLCTVTNEGILFIPQVQIIVKYLFGKSIDWFCKT